MKVLRYFLILCIAVVSGTLHAQSQGELGEGGENYSWEKLHYLS